MEAVWIMCMNFGLRPNVDTSSVRWLELPLSENDSNDKSKTPETPETSNQYLKAGNTERFNIIS